MTDRASNERHGKRFRLGDIWVTPSGNRIGGVRVEAKAMDVLLALVDAAPNPLSARALLQRVWPDVVVVDNVVYQAISQLRKAFGDDAQAPRFIDNVPRRGYRLITEVRGPLAATSSRGSLLRARHNLPTQLTSFIGREHELAEVGQLLAAHRLVTVVGVGGCGKTRLALAVANARLDAFPAGVWLVELAAITDPGQVISAVAKALGARETAGLSLHESLLAVLEKQQCLIVLDNCEHLIDVCAELAEAMLRKAPALRVLATSREALGSAGEHPWRIQPLAVPDPAMEPTVERMERIESVRLFIERAAVAVPGYALTEHNGKAVARICRQLDGIPLALELAAARVQTLSTEDIALRLADSFRMLTGGSRTAPPRQRTLQATLDWSHDLLPTPQQVLLRRLSVFINGFTLAAAEAVCGSDPLAPEDILDQLTRLIERSMVQVVKTGSRALRYRLLEPMRQYGQEKLVECDEVVTTRNRHRDYFVGLGAEFAAISREGTQSNDIYPRFSVESGDFGLALAWCLETDVGKGLKLATFLCRFMSTYEVAMNTRWLETFLACTSQTTPDRAEALCLSVMRDPDPTRRRNRLQQALAIARRSGDQWVETLSLVQLGNTLALSGEPAEGTRLVESALDLARNTGNANMLGWCLYFTDMRRMPGFRGCGEECIATFGNAGNQVGHVLALRKWVGALLEQPLDCVPREQIDELVVLSREQGYFQGIMVGLGLLGHFAEQRGDLHRALRFMEEANDVAPTAGLWITEHDLARVLSRLGEFERAAALYRDYLRRGLLLSVLTPIAFAQGLLGLAFVATGRSQCDLAARLYGASRRFRGERPRGIRGMSANEIKLEDDVIRMVSAVLGETSWVRLCAEGEAMTLQQATVLAMTDNPLERN